VFDFGIYIQTNYNQRLSKLLNALRKKHQRRSKLQGNPSKNPQMRSKLFGTNSVRVSNPNRVLISALAAYCFPRLRAMGTVWDRGDCLEINHLSLTINH
jgi:hypothetical protein